MHNVSMWDHRNLADFRAAARRELVEGRYSTVEIKETAIMDVVRTAEGIFEATDAAGEIWRGKTLVLATGVTDNVPDLPGYKECWESCKM